jgi:hypothetical protein
VAEEVAVKLWTGVPGLSKWPGRLAMPGGTWQEQLAAPEVMPSFARSCLI